MKTSDKRYQVYVWDRDAKRGIMKDYGLDLEDAIEYRLDVTWHGDLIDETDDEEEARKIMEKKLDQISSHDDIMIYDTVERRWFD